MTLGDMIKKYRIENDLSMEEFAKKSHISKAYVSVLENNKHPKTGLAVVPSITVFKKAADAMGIPFEVLFNQLKGTVQFPKDSEELQLIVKSSSAPPDSLSEPERMALTTFDLLDARRQKQAIAFLNYLLEEQQNEEKENTK